jgi:flavodoxin
MKYEVAYLSKSGNTAILAQEIAAQLAREEVHLTDLEQEDPWEDADVYFIGYGVNRGAVPMKVMDTLDLAEGKTVVLFVTGGMAPTQEHKEALERKVIPFLPDNCDYRGMFLCGGAFPTQLVEQAQSVLQQQPDNPQAKALLAHHQKTVGHPDNQDLDNLRSFLWERLDCPAAMESPSFPFGFPNKENKTRRL